MCFVFAVYGALSRHGGSAAGQAVISDSPDLVKSGVVDLITGSCPLHAAARGGSADAVEVLLRAGAAIEARDGHGWTALRVSMTVPAVSVPCAE